MNAKHDENPIKCASQNGKAKSVKAQITSRIARLVRAVGLDYEGWRYVSRQVRRKCDLHRPRSRRSSPVS